MLTKEPPAIQPPHSLMAVEGLVQLLDQPTHAWPSGWQTWPVTRNAYRLALERQVEAGPAYPGGYSGRGIVIGAGGQRYFTCAWLCVSLLRQLGCDLPVQLWHVGPGEIDPRMIDLIGRLGVECVDTLQVAAVNPSRTLRNLCKPGRRGYLHEVKPFALLHCPFREVLYIDADNVPVINPEVLFEWPAYRQHGAVFWPDPPYPAMPLTEAVWDACGLPPQPGPSFESGQLVMDKARCWPELVLTVWLNDHSDYWFHLVFGDKDTFKIAWHKRGRAYGLPAYGPRQLRWGYLQHDFEGRPLFQHCWNDKPRLDGFKSQLPDLIHRSLLLDTLAELRSIWHGRIWDWSDQTEEETRLAGPVAGTYLYRRLGQDERVLALRADGQIGRGADKLERRWSLRLLKGMPTLIISGEDKAILFLTAKEQGGWHGRWQFYERTLCELLAQRTE